MSRHPAALVALGFHYPGRGHADDLRSAAAALPDGKARSELERFVAGVGDLPLGEWEELHTRTVDLSPLFVPYVGHVAWGETYRRGAFMADMKATQIAAGLIDDGELPDHIASILRLLATGTPIPDDLAAILPAAVTEMRKDLKKREPDNPYRHLLAATSAIVAAALDESIGAHE